MSEFPADPNPPTSNGTANAALPFPSLVERLVCEWRDFERERASWSLEKANLEAQIARLENTVKTSDRVKDDLLKRVKMLEYALKAERARHAKLQQDQQQQQEGGDVPAKSEPMAQQSVEKMEVPVVPIEDVVVQSRGMLKRYLARFGIQDLDSVTGCSPKTLELLAQTSENAEDAASGSDNSAKQQQSQQSQTSGSTPSSGSQKPSSRRKQAQQQQEDKSRNDKEEPNDDEVAQMARDLNLDRSQVERMVKFGKMATKQGNRKDTPRNEGDVLAEGAGENPEPVATVSPSPTAAAAFASDLPFLDSPAPELTTHHTWSQAQTLRSHFDGVRDIAWHPREPFLVSASEDGTAKYWRLISQPSSQSADLEPLYTLRGHNGPVLGCAVSDTHAYTCSADGSIRAWVLDMDIDPTGPFPRLINYADSHAIYAGHSDAVWSVDCAHNSLLCSASADGSVKVWDTRNHSQVQSLVWSQGAVPVKSLFAPVVTPSSSAVVTVYQNGAVVVYDYSKGQVVHEMSASADQSLDASAAAYSIALHPVHPVAMTVHEDHKVRLYDLRASKCVASMVAHQDAVSSVAVAPGGAYFVTTGHDESVRFWDLASRRCFHEVPGAHRSKYDESVHCVAFHPGMPWLATGGADAVVKLYV